MKLNIPKHMLEQGKIAYNKIINEVPSKKDLETKTSSFIPKFSKDLEFITDKNLFKEINKYIKTEFPDLDNPLVFKDNIMKGSNPYIATAVDMFCKENLKDYRLATQLDLEQDLDFTKDTYNDSGLALRNLKNKNSSQAKYLFNQLIQRGMSEQDFPIWLNLRDLRLDKNLNFNLTKDSVYETQECLNWENRTEFSKINKLGLPKEKNSGGNRQIWTSNHALSRCYLISGSNLNSFISNLEDSGDNGRVVLSKSR